MGLMHRVMDLQKTSSDPLPQNFGSSYVQTQELPSQISNYHPQIQDTPGNEKNTGASFGNIEIEEVLIQMIQAIPETPKGFVGLYQSFHLLRDLLGFQKLMLLTLTDDGSRFEPFLSFGFEESSRLGFSITRDSLPKQIRYQEADSVQLDSLSDSDRQGAIDPYFLVTYGTGKTKHLLLGCGVYTSLQKSGNPVLGPISQILGLQVHRFTPQFSGMSRFVSKSDFSQAMGINRNTLVLDMKSLVHVLREYYPDVVEHRLKSLVYQILEAYLPQDFIFTSDSNALLRMFIEVPNVQLLDIILKQVFNHLVKWFGLPDDQNWLSLEVLPL